MSYAGIDTKSMTDADINAIRTTLQNYGGSKYDDTDLQDVLRHTNYDVGGASLDQAIAAEKAKYDSRDAGPAGGGNNNPNPSNSYDPYVAMGLPNGTASSSGGAGSSGGGGSSNPSAQGVPNTDPGGVHATQAQLDQLLSAIQGINNQPDVDLSGLTVADVPTINVPGENLSPAIDDTLLDIMGGSDPLNTGGYLADLLKRTQGGGINSERLQTRLEQAREQLTRGETGALADIRASLADRGLIGTPGHPEGAELDSTVRAFEPLQRAYLDSVRTSTADESMRADAAELDALTRATGWTKDQATARLQAATTANGRQQMLSEIALRTLEDNQQWNEFLATFGLDREKTAESIRQGRIAAIAPIMQMFLALTAQSRGGYI